MKLFKSSFKKTGRFLLTEISISLTLSLISLFLFLRISSQILQNQVIKSDAVVANFIQSFRSVQLTEIMLLVTFLGGITVFIIISILMIIYLYSKNKKDIFFYSSILSVGLILNFILKYVIQRPRPELSIVVENTPSFPSGHAMNSFVLFTTLSYFIFRESKNLKITIFISILSIILILLIGFSRIYLGVHFPSDVVAGWIAGFFLVISAILFEKVIILKRLYKKNKK